MSFVKDLAFGKESEQKVLERVQELFPLDEWMFSEDKKAVDIVSSSGKTIECKSDRQTLTTGNVFIEVECNGKPSGIFKYNSLDVLAYSYGDITILINVKKLSNYIQENNTSLKKIKCGDGWRSVGYLIKLTEFTKLSSIIINN